MTERKKSICTHAREQGKGRGRERDSQADSLLLTEPDAGLDPTTPDHNLS